LLPRNSRGAERELSLGGFRKKWLRGEGEKRTKPEV